MDWTDTAQGPDKHAILTDSTRTQILLAVMQWKNIFLGKNNENEQSLKIGLTLHMGPICSTSTEYVSNLVEAPIKTVHVSVRI